MSVFKEKKNSKKFNMYRTTFFFFKMFINISPACRFSTLIYVLCNKIEPLLTIMSFVARVYLKSKIIITKTV